MLFLLLDFVNHKIHRFISDFLLSENIIQNSVLSNSCLHLYYKAFFEITDFDPYNTNLNKIKDFDHFEILYSLPAGVEPAISTVRGWRPRPLDHESMLKRSEWTNLTFTLAGDRTQIHSLEGCCSIHWTTRAQKKLDSRGVEPLTYCVQSSRSTN